MLWSFDLDGVLAEPPFGWNPAIDQDVTLAPASDIQRPSVPGRHVVDRLLESSWYRVRYFKRPPRAGAREAVRAAAQCGRVMILTGRHERGRRQTQAWLERHGFDSLVEELVMNGSPLKSARFKEAVLRVRDAALHIDDDAATCALLARNGVEVGLVSWPRNRGLDYPDGVTRCDDLEDVRTLIERVARGD
ncbi:MAG: hypothetical protein F4Z51_00520 [Chloroflexi bacterium]|nr:hypothetical protein [Chloroflexota bacterium]